MMTALANYLATDVLGLSLSTASAKVAEQTPAPAVDAISSIEELTDEQIEAFVCEKR